jgi:hypothetical protein
LIKIHDRLVPPGVGGTRALGRMNEVDLGQVTRPKENVTGEISYVPVQRLDSQDYEEKESDRCDRCKDHWISEDRFKTEKDVPEQTLGHIQNTCEDLSVGHIDAQHQC